MFIIAVDVKHSLIALSKVMQGFEHIRSISPDIAGYDAHRAGSLGVPRKVSPAINV
jgi:hypothetical protein